MSDDPNPVLTSSKSCLMVNANIEVIANITSLSLSLTHTILLLNAYICSHNGSEKNLKTTICGDTEMLTCTNACMWMHMQAKCTEHTHRKTQGHRWLLPKASF